ncbi:MAG: DUF1501 domain-containing protein [Planctomycetales bacterium]|nr:DUF1501 domain-containing protein [Planctomycetales bacterium]
MNFQQYVTLQQRRLFLRHSACSLGAIALGSLITEEGRSAASHQQPSPQLVSHFKPTAKNVIFVFMSGAPSQLDLFEPKPKLTQLHGEPVPASLLKGLNDPLIEGSAAVMASPRTFKKYGECGMDFSDFLPNLGTQADNLCMVRSLVTDISNHHPAQQLMNCGVPRFGHPSMGSWVTYGLGSEASDLPGFVVMLSDSGSGVDGGSSLWTNGFLPSSYRGVTFRGQGDPILHLSSPPGVGPRTQRARLDAIGNLNRRHFEATGDPEIASRIASYELAFRMQTAGPELIDLSQEMAATRALYGLDNETTQPFGTNCLLARRLVERGVRFVQLYHSTWDDHADLNKKLKTNCDMTDLPMAGLLKDLKQRGLLDETLVIWGGEFGRAPMNEVRRGNAAGREGRDHHRFAFTMLLAGGGIRPGHIVGETDDFGYHVTQDKLHVHDLQATILHCLGMDHKQLTYRHQGRDFRLTDVAGEVKHQLLA